MTNDDEDMSLEEIVIAWDVKLICEALKIPEDSTIEYILHIIFDNPRAHPKVEFDKAYWTKLKKHRRGDGLNVGIAKQTIKWASEGHTVL